MAVEQVPPSMLYGYRRLREIGLTNEQAFGVIGSMMQESGPELNSTAVNPTSGAFGIAQHLGPRLVELERFADANGIDVNAPETQWEFIIHELGTTEQRALNEVASAQTRGDAAFAWTKFFERPAEEEFVMDRRNKFADAAAGMLTSVDAQVGGIFGDSISGRSGGAFDRLLTQLFGSPPSGDSRDDEPVVTPSANLSTRGFDDDGTNSLAARMERENPSQLTGEDPFASLNDAFGSLFGDEGRDSVSGQIGTLLGGMVGGAPGAIIGRTIGSAIDRGRDDDRDSDRDGLGGLLGNLFGLGRSDNRAPAARSPNPVAKPVVRSRGGSDDSSDLAPATSPRPKPRPSRRASTGDGSNTRESFAPSTSSRPRARPEIRR